MSAAERIAVMEGELDEVIVGPRRERELTIGRGRVVHGVARVQDQIEDDLLQLNTIAPNGI